MKTLARYGLMVNLPAKFTSKLTKETLKQDVKNVQS